MTDSNTITITVDRFYVIVSEVEQKMDMCCGLEFKPCDHTIEFVELLRAVLFPKETPTRYKPALAIW